MRRAYGYAGGTPERKALPSGTVNAATVRVGKRQLLLLTETLREQGGEPQRQSPGSGNPPGVYAPQRSGSPPAALSHQHMASTLFNLQLAPRYSR